MAKKILITGASGLVGSRLTELLLQKGYSVVHIGRNQRVGTVPSFVWDVEKKTIDPRALESVDSIVHLAGAGVVDKRWTPERKKELIDSRVDSIDLLYQALQKGNHSVKTFVSASAIGYYGVEGGSNEFRETSPSGTDFLAQLVKVWEEASVKIEKLGIRVAKLRIGIVLSDKGGALKSMAQPVKLGVGSALASGKQYLSWVHLDDLCRAFVKAVEDDSMKGVYNVAGVQPVTNRQMTEVIAKVLKRPLWLPPVPGFMLRIILGEMAYIVITGSNVSSEKIINTGFQFQFTDLEKALRNIFARNAPSQSGDPQ